MPHCAICSASTSDVLARDERRHFDTRDGLLLAHDLGVEQRPDRHVGDGVDRQQPFDIDGEQTTRRWRGASSDSRAAHRSECLPPPPPARAAVPQHPHARLPVRGRGDAPCDSPRAAQAHRLHRADGLCGGERDPPPTVASNIVGEHSARNRRGGDVGRMDGFRFHRGITSCPLPIACLPVRDDLSCRGRRRAVADRWVRT